MEVTIKQFKISMELKQSGIELQVNDTDGAHQGDCYVSMKGITWCKGRKDRRNGVPITWKQLMEIAKSKESVRAAVQAARDSD